MQCVTPRQRPATQGGGRPLNDPTSPRKWPKARVPNLASPDDEIVLPALAPTKDSLRLPRLPRYTLRTSMSMATLRRPLNAARALPSEAETQLVKDLETLSLLDPDEATLRKQFELWDADGSGHIDFNELTIALHNFGFKHTPAEVNEILDKADADRSGHLSYAEFRRAFKTPSAAEKWVASMPVSRLIATQVCRGVQRLLGGNLLTYTHTHTHTQRARAHTHTDSSRRNGQSKPAGWSGSIGARPRRARITGPHNRRGDVGAQRTHVAKVHIIHIHTLELTHIHVHTHTHTHTYMYTHTHTHTYTYTYIYMHMYVCMTCVCVCMNVCVYVCVYACV